MLIKHMRQNCFSDIIKSLGWLRFPTALTAGARMLVVVFILLRLVHGVIQIARSGPFNSLSETSIWTE